MIRASKLSMRLLPAIAILIINLGPGPAFGQEIRATVQGGVARPGMYAVQKGGRLSTLIEKAGGYTDNAWLPGAVLNRASLKESRKETLADLVSRAEADTRAAKGDEETKRSFFRHLASLEPTGRMRAPLAHLRLLKGSGKDILLEDRDILVIPEGKTPVSVAGAVRNGPSSFPHADGLEPGDYIRMAGGFAADADPGRAFILKADAAAPIPSKGWIRWNPEQSRWEISAFGEAMGRIEPGDTIVVPRKRPPGSWAAKLKNLDDLLMRAAALTGVFVEAP